MSNDNPRYNAIRLPRLNHLRHGNNLTRKSELSDYFQVNDFDEYGELFLLPDGKVFDSSTIRILHTGVDTVKQLFKCNLKYDLFYQIQRDYNQYKGNDFFIEIASENWTIKSGFQGGYRLLLQNEEKSVIVLLGAKHQQDIESHGHHLKIELSPSILLTHDIEGVNQLLLYYAHVFATQITFTGCAVHICADIQGWQPDINFSTQLVTRVKKRVAYSGVSEFCLASSSVCYGNAQSFRFGLANSLQFACYNKTAELSNSTRDMWQSVWNTSKDPLDEPFYKDDRPVFRLEFRFHHSVIQQFQRDLNQKDISIDLSRFINLAPHLTGLWRYCMNNFRLDYSKSYIHPFWQYIRDAVHFFDIPPLYKQYFRCYIKPSHDLTDKQLRQTLGHLLGIYRRLGYSVDKVIECLNAAELMPLIEEMYSRNGISLNLFSTYVANRLAPVSFVSSVYPPPADKEY